MHQIKYPTELLISQVDEEYRIIFTDQFSFSCASTAFSASKKNEIVFQFCGGGVKSELSSAPIHHAKVVDGKLLGVVTTDRHLFNWVGERDEQAQNLN